eukprot:scaffold63451_cov63-Phaeocystis_antarctica.AAC.3
MVRRVGTDIEAKRKYDRETKAARTKMRKASGTYDLEAKRKYDRERCSQAMGPPQKKPRKIIVKSFGCNSSCGTLDCSKAYAGEKALMVHQQREADPKLAGPRVLALSGRPCSPRPPSPVSVVPAPYQLPFSMEVDLFSDVMRLPTSTSTSPRTSHDLNRVGLSYRCGRCGQPKKGHECAVADGDGSPGMLADSPAELAPAVTPESLPTGLGELYGYLAATPSLTNVLAMGKVVSETLANLNELEVTGLDLEEPPEGWERAAHLGVPPGPEGWELAAYLDVLTTTERASLAQHATIASW